MSCGGPCGPKRSTTHLERHSCSGAGSAGAQRESDGSTRGPNGWGGGSALSVDAGTDLELLTVKKLRELAKVGWGSIGCSVYACGLCLLLTGVAAAGSEHAWGHSAAQQMQGSGVGGG